MPYSYDNTSPNYPPATGDLATDAASVGTALTAAVTALDTAVTAAIAALPVPATTGLQVQKIQAVRRTLTAQVKTLQLIERELLRRAGQALGSSVPE